MLIKSLTVRVPMYPYHMVVIDFNTFSGTDSPVETSISLTFKEIELITRAEMEDRILMYFNSIFPKNKI